MDRIRRPLVLTRPFLLRAKMDRFIQKSVWQLLLVALLITFGLSFRGRNWNTYGVLIFLGIALVLVGFSLLFIRWSAKRQEKKWGEKSLILEINATHVQVEALPGGDVILPWEQVKSRLNSSGWVFSIMPFPHYIFIERGSLSDEEHAQLKNWVVKMEPKPAQNTLNTD
ncbi:MAG: hypothetical protein INR69_16825 [Mucilaginibacter polytrichastri]|nr:hypothetical protein [Mucilaginibacter polytrichastri]